MAAGRQWWSWTAVGLLGVIVGVALGRATAPAGQPASPPAATPHPVVVAEPQHAGPSRSERGVGVGFARSEAGAVAAAASYVTALDGRRGLIPAERTAVLDLIAASSARDALARQIEPGMDLLAQAGGLTASTARSDEFVARSVLAGHRLEAFTPDEATVAIWGTSVLVVPGGTASSGGWSTELVGLRWERGDWRLATRQVADGPAPPLAGATPPGLGAQINGFQPFAHVPAP